MIDLLNFSFWSDLDVADKSIPHPDRYAVQYQGTNYTGYWSLCAAINRGTNQTRHLGQKCLHFFFFVALEEGIPITDPAYYGYKATDQDIANIFRSDTKESIPMLSERIKVMREAGRVLCEVCYECQERAK